MKYAYGSSRPHAVTDAGDKMYSYDANGNMTGWTSKTSGANRTITWNEENRVKSIADSGSTTDFLYDDAGERAVKRGQHGESVYINRFYAVKNGDLGTKHIFAGETRVVTKLEKDGGSIQSGVPGSNAFIVSQGIQNAILQGSGQKKGINRRLTGTDTGGGTTTTTNPPIEAFQYYYHGDHLGSSSFITDDAGQVYQELEYFPYGESWVEDGGSGQMPYYRFTGKELDTETGLYYYGARYYDPVLSRWISADPILGKYLPSGSKRQSLPGYGGIFNSVNLNVYAYAHENPIIFGDPDGNSSTIRIIVYEYNPSAQYGSVAYIQRDGHLIGPYIYNVRADFGSAPEMGTYYFSVGKHPMSDKTNNKYYYTDHGKPYKALNIFSDKKRQSRIIPILGITPDGRETASGQNVHVGNPAYSDAQGNMLNRGDPRPDNPAKQVTTGSEICANLPASIEPNAQVNPSDPLDWNYYSDFIGNLEPGEVGEYMIIRNPINELAEDLGSRAQYHFNKLWDKLTGKDGE